jgi:DNA-binding transcriptional ArsR family regulator
LTRLSVGASLVQVLDVAVISDSSAAEVALDATRARLLAELRQPASAVGLAERLGLPRQKINYHLRLLEQHGLVELVEERRKGNCTERVVQATGLSYLISPEALDAIAPDPRRGGDRISSQWLLALAGQLVRDVGQLLSGAERAGQPLATFALDGRIRFASAADRAAFAEELATAVADLVGRYHDESAPRGREHRIVLALHPATKPARVP